MTGITDIAIATALKYIIGKTLDIGGKGFFKRRNKFITAFKSRDVLNNYSRNYVNKVFTFRTLLHSNHDVYLDEIYYPLTVRSIIDYDHPILVTDNTILPDHTPIVISGLAGQGKTIIMRKLFLEELNYKNKLPFFITLRHIGSFDNLSCEQLLADHMHSNGVQCSLEDVQYLLEKSPTSFYFDGFDEIPSNQRLYAIKVINECRDKYNCKVVVSSRPDTEMLRQPGYNVYTIDFLDSKDLVGIISNIIQKKELLNFFTALLDKNKLIQNCITTPILLDIFLVTSRNLNHEPRSIIDYYDGLFPALMYRHDLIKNLTRCKKSNLHDRELENCFSLFSFLSYIAHKNDFTKEELIFYFKKAVELNKTQALPESILEDILDTTNLITLDGYNNYSYLHRSIQEFYAAKYFSVLNEESKEPLYDRMSKFPQIDGYYFFFMFFLSCLDSYSFIELYLLKQLKRYNLYNDNKVRILNKEEFKSLFNVFYLFFNLSIYKSINISYQSDFTSPISIVNHVDIFHILLNNSILSTNDEIIYHAMVYIKSQFDKKNRNLINNNLIPYKDLGNVADSNDRLAVIYDMSSVYEYLDGFEKVIDELYQKHIEKVEDIQLYLDNNYFKKINEKNSLESIISNMKYEI